MFINIYHSVIFKSNKTQWGNVHDLDVDAGAGMAVVAVLPLLSHTIAAINRS